MLELLRCRLQLNVFNVCYVVFSLYTYVAYLNVLEGGRKYFRFSFNPQVTKEQATARPTQGFLSPSAVSMNLSLLSRLQATFQVAIFNQGISTLTPPLAPEHPNIHSCSLAFPGCMVTLKIVFCSFVWSLRIKSHLRAGHDLIVVKHRFDQNPFSNHHNNLTSEWVINGGHWRSFTLTLSQYHFMDKNVMSLSIAVFWKLCALWLVSHRSDSMRLSSLCLCLQAKKWTGSCNSLTAWVI